MPASHRMLALLVALATLFTAVAASAQQNSESWVVLREEPLKLAEIDTVRCLPLGFTIQDEQALALAISSLRQGDHVIVPPGRVELIHRLPKDVTKVLCLPAGEGRLLETEVWRKAIAAADALTMENTNDEQAARSLRKTADACSKQVLLSPTPQNIKKMGAAIAPHGDIFLIQAQDWLQEDESPQLVVFCEAVHRAALKIREANPKIQIWLQVGNEADRGAGNAGLFVHAYARLKATFPEDVQALHPFITTSSDLPPKHGPAALQHLLKALRSKPRFFALDWTVLIGYLVLSAVVGLMQFHKKETAEDYLLAGRRFRWGPVALSVVATLFSANSFVGVPQEAYESGLQFYVTAFTLPLVAPIVIMVFLPLYDRLRVVSAYEYLEKRFNLPARLLASGMFIILRIAWMAAMTYTTALLLRDISGIPMGYSIAIMGGVTMLYTVTGGMAAVVWTDVLQFFVFMIGIFAIAGIVAWRVGGVDDVFAVAYAHDKLHVIGDLGLDFHKRLTFWGLLIGVSFVNLDYYAVDQMVLQRYFSSKDKSQSRRALIFNACFSPLFGFLLYFIGLGLFAFYLKYSSVAQAMPDDQKVLPYFIVNEIPRGLAGLIVAAVFAATMSSISSGLNSLATTTVVDFHERLHGRPADAKDAVRVSRIATLAYGVFILLIAYLIAVYWESPKVIELTYRLSNPFTGVILGLFLIGLFTRRVPGIPAVIGGVVGLVVVGYVVFCTDISFLWYSAASCMTTILVTALLSPFFRPQPRETLVDLTVYDRTTR